MIKIAQIGALALVGLMLTAQASAKKDKDDDEKEFDWEEATTLHKEMEIALQEEDVHAYTRVAREMALLSSDSSAYVIGYNVNQNSLMAGHLKMWSGDVYQAHLNPFASDFASGGYVVAQDVPALKGKIGFAAGKFPIGTKRYRNTFFRRNAKNYDDAVKVYQYDDSTNYKWDGFVRNACDNFSQEKKHIKEVYDQTRDGLLLLPSNLYCPELVEQIAKWSLVEFGITMSENGDKLAYVKFFSQAGDHEGQLRMYYEHMGGDKIEPTPSSSKASGN